LPKLPHFFSEPFSEPGAPLEDPPETLGAKWRPDSPPGGWENKGPPASSERSGKEQSARLPGPCFCSLFAALWHPRPRVGSQQGVRGSPRSRGFPDDRTRRVFIRSPGDPPPISYWGPCYPRRSSGWMRRGSACGAARRPSAPVARPGLPRELAPPPTAAGSATTKPVSGAIPPEEDRGGRGGSVPTYCTFLMESLPPPRPP